MDGIKCECGAVTAVGNIGKNESPVLFVGGSYKGSHSKHSLNPAKNEAKERCLWCGSEWPENIKNALRKAKP